VTSKASFDGVIRKYLEYEPMINKSYQFILLVGNKCDLEEYRELSNEDVESVAAQHNMIFIETSTLTGRNLDYVAKVIRVRAA
jgi:Ras-related protein Rab-11A